MIKRVPLFAAALQRDDQPTLLSPQDGRVSTGRSRTHEAIILVDTSTLPITDQLKTSSVAETTFDPFVAAFPKTFIFATSVDLVVRHGDTAIYYQTFRGSIRIAQGTRAWSDDSLGTHIIDPKGECMAFDNQADNAEAHVAPLKHVLHTADPVLHTAMWQITMEPSTRGTHAVVIRTYSGRTISITHTRLAITSSRDAPRD
jgi:hypothetical protein